MNGRCENDALDAAIDVCDACGGEFCHGCLLFPNGPKKTPLCTACAISASGVRKAAKRERLQSRSSASKRRKELRKLAAAEQTNNLVVLDDLPDIDFGTSSEPEPEPKKKRLRRKGDKTKTTAAEPVVAETEAAENAQYVETHSDETFAALEFDPESAAPDSASKLIDEIRTTGSVEAVTNEEADLWNFPSDFEEPETELDGWTPATETHADFDDVERTQNAEAVFEQEPVQQPKHDEEPHKWEALHDPDASNPFDDPSVGQAASASQAPPAGSDYETNFPAPDSDAGPLFENEEAIPTPPQQQAPLPQRNSSPDDRRVNRVPAPQHRSPSPATTADWHNAPGSADLHPESEAAADASPATPAPLVQPAPPQPKRNKMLDLLHSKTAEPAPVVKTPAVVQERVQDPTTDTDASGKWIPPNLRGMVSSAEQTELPKRQRGG